VRGGDRGLATQFVVHSPGGHVERFTLGAHAPHLTPEDIDRIHQIWVDATKTVGSSIHHRDIVVAALDSFEQELRSNPSAAAGRLRGRTSTQ